MRDHSKPLPVVNDLSRPFWNAARRHELHLPQCTRCDTVRLYFEKWCSTCGSDEFQWNKVSGRGTVWSHCEFHKSYFPGYAEDLPYNVALVKLLEGPLMITNIVNVPYDEIHIGLDVIAHFDDVSSEVALIKFRPKAKSS